MNLIDNGAPVISVAQAEFEDAAKKWQESAAYAASQAAKYTELARNLGIIYNDAIKRSQELGD